MSSWDRWKVDSKEPLNGGDIIKVFVWTLNLVLLLGIALTVKNLPKQPIYVEVTCPAGYHVRSDRTPDTVRYFCDSDRPIGKP